MGYGNAFVVWGEIECVDQPYAWPSIKWKQLVTKNDGLTETQKERMNDLVKDSLNFMIYENGVHFTVVVWYVYSPEFKRVKSV